MKGLSVLLHCVVVAASLVTTPSAPAADTFQGTVVGAANGELILMLGTESPTFRLEKGAPITLDGKPAELNQLKTGFSATVTAQRSEGRVWIAKSITAKSA